MSQENVEIVKRLFPPNREIHSHGTTERRGAMRAIFEPLIAEAFSVKFIAAGFPAAYPGADGMADGVRDYTSGFLNYRTVMERFVDGGEVVVALGRQRGRTKTHGLEFDEEMGMVFLFDPDRKLTRIECYQRWSEASKPPGCRSSR